MGKKKFSLPIVFVHIPKTAGMSFIKFIENIIEGEIDVGKKQFTRVQEMAWNYSASCWPEEVVKDKVLISGHFPYKNIQEELGAATYITLLRKPVDQVVSHYWQVRRRNFTNNSSPSRSRKLIDFDNVMTLDAVVEAFEEGRQTYIDNVHVRFLGGKSAVTKVPKMSEAQWKESLEIAKLRLIKEFSFFGICEEMEASESLFCSMFGLSKQYMGTEKQNVRPLHQSIEQPRMVTQKLIAKQNRYDQELYEFALEKFKQRIQQTEIK